MGVGGLFYIILFHLGFYSGSFKRTAVEVLWFSLQYKQGFFTCFGGLKMLSLVLVMI